MNPVLPGIHHVTAITGDGQRNLDFYVGLLGLRLVKWTVNFDDPASYHFYYGDYTGRPGTAMTFFVWDGGRRGRVGPPQAVATQFAVPVDSMDYWSTRLAAHEVEARALTRFDEPVLLFQDPDGMPLELVGAADAPPDQPTEWGEGPVPVECAVRGFAGVTLASPRPELTGALLGNIMGFEKEQAAADRVRYRGTGSLASALDVLTESEVERGLGGTGTVHHVAFRTPDDEHQKGWQAALQDRGFDVSPVRDRCYFHSIYFHEPGGALFEIATEGPGFTIDEQPAELGTRLQLPPWLEKERPAIERALPDLRLPCGRA